MKNHCELNIPICLLQQAGINPEAELSVTICEGSLIIEGDAPDMEELWSEYENEDAIRQLPEELKRLLMDCGIHPETAIRVVEEGGLEF